MNFPSLISGPKINDRKNYSVHFCSKVERNGMTIYGMIFNLFDNGEVQPFYRCKNKKKTYLSLHKIKLFPSHTFFQSFSFKPWISTSDQHLISPCNISWKSHIKVMRMKEMITNQLKLLTVKQILLISNLGNVQRTVWRICIPMIA